MLRSVASYGRLERKCAETCANQSGGAFGPRTGESSGSLLRRSKRIPCSRRSWRALGWIACWRVVLRTKQSATARSSKKALRPLQRHGSAAFTPLPASERSHQLGCALRLPCPLCITSRCGVSAAQQQAEPHGIERRTRSHTRVHAARAWGCGMRACEPLIPLKQEARRVRPHRTTAASRTVDRSKTCASARLTD
jgi:hypothetical protein